jgi:diguanylate cyclase (GGDEF)-like protein/PAS domain S-box-containing protein
MLTKALPRHSLKTRILLATLILFVAGIWSLSLFASRVLRDDITNLLGEQQRTTVAYVAAEIDKEIDNRIKELELIAASITSARFTEPGAVQEELEQLLVLQRLFNAGIWATDEEGTTLADVPRSTGRLGVNYKDREYFQNAFRNDRPAVATPLMGRVVKWWILVIAVPVHDGQGRVIGTLCGGVRLDQPNFLDPITQHRHGKTGGFLLVSPERRMIIVATDHSRNVEVLPPHGVNPDTDRSLDGYRGTQIQKDARGVEILVSTHSIPSAGWYVAASLPTEEAFAPIADIRRSILMAAAVLTLAACGVLWWILHRQLLPLESTAGRLAAMRDHGGLLEPLPAVSTDEIDTLIGAFNELLESLHRREQALQESEERFKSLHEGSFGGIAIHDKGTILECNQSLAEMTGYGREELKGMDGLLLIAPAWRGQVMRKIAGNDESAYEAEGRRKDGTVFPLAIRGKNIPYKGHTVRVTEFRDISDQKHVEQQQRIAAIAFESQGGLVIADADRRMIRANQAFSRITGYPIEELIGMSPRILGSGRHPADFFEALKSALETDSFWQGEIWNRRKDGDEYPAWLTITTVRNEGGAITHYVASLEDITLRKGAEEEIKYLAFFDQLTGLPNRRLLADRLKQALAASCRHNHCGALLFIDLDNFKTLNDTLGHDQGDILLQQVAERLASCVRDGDTVARLGGDEFVVMLESLSDSMQEAAAHAEIVGEKIVVSLGQPYQLAGYEHRSSASIGVAMFLGCNDVAEELLKRADMAMYQAKSAGRNTMRFFDPEMQAVVSARATLEAGLREAVQKSHFVLDYQAQVDSACHITGAEVLLRWHAPHLALVPPRVFIPVAEETGLILPIGQWVLDTACERLAAWAQLPTLSQLSIAVNISARQFQQKNFVDQVLKAIERTGANPRLLKLELTESMLVHDVDDVIAKMAALKAEGVGFSLDDFGTGYSSLAYLKRLPFDQLKIDQGFIRDILSDPDDAAIARMIVALGENFGLTVIAEGVESEEQLFKLAEQGCNHYQGFLFCRPLSLAEFEAYVGKSET